MSEAIGQGIWRIGPKEERERLLSVKVTEHQAANLDKLKRLTNSNIEKGEVVSLALDLLFMMSTDEIVQAVRDRRSRDD